MLGRYIRDLAIAKLEEKSPFGTSESEVHLAGSDFLQEVKPIYEYVDDFLSEAANEILSIVPLSVAPYSVWKCSARADEDDKATGYISLPNNYLRLHTLIMRGWTQPVHHVTLEHEPLYEQQFNHWTRGTCQKPVVIYHHNADVKESSSSSVRDVDMANEMVNYNNLLA